MYASLGRWCFNHPWRVFGAWLCAAVILGGLAATLGASYGAEPSAPDSESRRSADILEAHFGSVGSNISGTVVVSVEQGVESLRPELVDMLARIDTVEGVVVGSPFDPDGARRIANHGPEAGRIAYADIETESWVEDSEASELGAEIDAIVQSSGLRDLDGVQIEIGGAWLAAQEPPESEAIGLAFALIVLILALGSVVAMGVTVVTALVGVGLGVTAIVLISNAATVPEFAPTLGVMIGLGVGIDYTLFILTRYREWRDSGLTAVESAAAALDTAGRSVLFAGATVVVSLLGLLLIGLPFVAGIGLAAAATVTIVLLASLTLLPAALGLIGEAMTVTVVKGVTAAALVSVGLFGIGTGLTPLAAAIPLAVIVLVAGSFGGARNPLRRRLRERRPKPRRETSWYRFSRVVQSRPWLFAVGGTAVLLLFAAPVLDLRLGFSDEGNFSEDTTTRKAYDLLVEGFGAGANGPLLIVAEIAGPDQVAVLGDLTDTLNGVDGVVTASPPQLSGDGAAALIRVQPVTGPQDRATEDLLHSLRSEVIPTVLDGSGVDAHVGGRVAFQVDFSDYLAGRMLVFFAAVLGASFLLLTAVFRSLIVPLKAVVMNMLSIGAAYGVAVAIFQWGWFGGVLGIAPAPIEPFIPMMLFAILFGLSMDYEVFLLSRMKEEYERTGDAVTSVADGLAATARVITAAAAIMVVVFGSFVLEDNRVIKLFGLGLATAIALDATLVRMLIVPSTMELLGARNWWLPRRLDRIIPHLRIEGTTPHSDRAG